MERVSRIERERRRRQREFLEAAEDVFSRKGFRDATIHEISEKSEFAVGSIYHMFENKEEIYVALLLMRFEEYLSLLEERISVSSDPVEKIRIFIRNKFDYFSKRKSFFRLFLNTHFGERWGVRVGLPDELISRFDEYLSLVSRIFEEGIRKGAFVESDPLGMTLALEGITNAFMSYSLSLRHEGEKAQDLNVTTVERIFLRGILKRGRVGKR